MGSVTLTVPLRKSATEGKFYGVVLAPDIPDSQGDVLRAEEIEKACHRFMARYVESCADHAPDIQHTGRPAGAELIENYIAPSDISVGGEPVTKGSWVQAWQVHEAQTRRELENGELTGLSIEGSGFRRPI